MSSLPSIFSGRVPDALICPMCLSPLRSPVLGACGHTFCMSCARSARNGSCPFDGHALQPLAEDVARSEDIDGLLIHCRHGLRLTPAGYVPDATRCPVLVMRRERARHEDVCPFAAVPAEAAAAAELDAAARACPHAARGCRFADAAAAAAADDDDHAAAVAAHLLACPYEAVKAHFFALEQQLAEARAEADALRRERDDGVSAALRGLQASRDAVVSSISHFTTSVVARLSSEENGAMFVNALHSAERSLAAARDSLTALVSSSSPSPRAAAADDNDNGNNHDHDDASQPSAQAAASPVALEMGGRPDAELDESAAPVVVAGSSPKSRLRSLASYVGNALQSLVLSEEDLQVRAALAASLRTYELELARGEPGSGAAGSGSGSGSGSGADGADAQSGLQLSIAAAAAAEPAVAEAAAAELRADAGLAPAADPLVAMEPLDEPLDDESFVQLERHSGEQ